MISDELQQTYEVSQDTMSTISETSSNTQQFDYYSAFYDLFSKEFDNPRVIGEIIAIESEDAKQFINIKWGHKYQIWELCNDWPIPQEFQRHNVTDTPNINANITTLTGLHGEKQSITLSGSAIKYEYSPNPEDPMIRLVQRQQATDQFHALDTIQINITRENLPTDHTHPIPNPEAYFQHGILNIDGEGTTHAVYKELGVLEKDISLKNTNWQTNPDTLAQNLPIYINPYNIQNCYGVLYYMYLGLSDHQYENNI